jgi:hypothetical protein
MPEQLYGPFGALAVLVFVVAALIRGDFVPGWVYRNERDNRIKAETQAERNTEAIKEVTATVKAALDDQRDR